MHIPLFILPHFQTLCGVHFTHLHSPLLDLHTNWHNIIGHFYKLAPGPGPDHDLDQDQEQDTCCIFDTLTVQVDIVREKRLYSAWYETPAPTDAAPQERVEKSAPLAPPGYLCNSSGIIGAKRVLNILHGWLAENHYSEVCSSLYGISSLFNCFSSFFR